MSTKRVHTCPVCNWQIARSPNIRLYGLRWHRECWPGQAAAVLQARERGTLPRGRPRKPGGRGDQDRVQVSVSLTRDEAAQLDAWRGEESRAEYVRRRGLVGP